MKKIEAIVRTEKLSDTIKGLKSIGVTGFTVSQVVGRGRQKDSEGVYRGKTFKVNLHPKIKLEIILSDHMVEKTIKAVMDAAKTGENGDGKIYVYPVFEAYSIRTGEADTDIDDLAIKEE